MLTQNSQVEVQQANGHPSIEQVPCEQQPLQRVQPFLVTRVDRTNTAVPHAVAARGLAQMFGLDFRAAILAVIVDLLVFGGDAISFGLLLPLGIGVAAVLSFIVYKIQRQSGDDHDSALIKSLIIGLLTAIPAPLTPLFAIPAGIIGVVNCIGGRNQKPSR
jgi:hypothetical protein